MAASYRPPAALYPFESHWLELQDGIRLHYLDEGPRDAPVLLMLHNLHHYKVFIDSIGEAVDKERFQEFKGKVLGKQQ